MAIDFLLKRVPRLRVGSIVRIGPWKEENLRTEFGELVRWSSRHGARTGRWVFFERGKGRWEACLEVKDPPPVDGRIRLKTLPSGWAASLTFDPELVSSRIVYHALSDWTRRRRRSGEIAGVTGVREVYPGDPWRDRRAWSACEVQFLVRR